MLTWSRVEVVCVHVHHWVKSVWWNTVVVILNRCSLLFTVTHWSKVASTRRFAIQSDCNWVLVVACRLINLLKLTIVDLVLHESSHHVFWLLRSLVKVLLLSILVWHITNLWYNTICLHLSRFFGFQLLLNMIELLMVLEILII